MTKVSRGKRTIGGSGVAGPDISPAAAGSAGARIRKKEQGDLSARTDVPRLGRTGWAALAIVLVITLGIFLPVLRGEFLSWDDDVYVTANSTVQSLDGANLSRILGGFVSGNYQPVVLVSYALDHAIYGLDPRGFHATQLFLHLACTALAFFWLRRLSGSLTAAAVGAAFFAWHPMRVESVAWVSDRKDLLAACFVLGSMLCFPSDPHSARKGRWTASLGLFVLACGSKGTAVIMPLVLILTEWLQGRRLDRRLALRMAPFFVVAVIFGLVSILARRSYEPVLQEARFGLLPMTHLAAWRLVFYYLARTVWPLTHLSNLYPPMGASGTAMPPFFLLALFGALAVLAMIGWGLRKARPAGWGGLVFLLLMAPSLALPNLGYSADRFSYLPAIGLAFSLGVGVEAVRRKLTVGSGRRGWAVWVPAAAAGVLLSLASAERIGVWRDNVSLWSDAIAHYPRTPDTRANLAIAYVYRGDAWVAKGESASAMADYTEAISTDPGVVDAWFGRGQLHESLGEVDRALADLERVLALDPRHREAHLHLARLRYERGDYEEALRLSEAVETLGVRVNPEVMKFLRERTASSR